MNWTKEHPKRAEYYWAIPKDKDSWLDGSPEIVKVYFNGKWSVIRCGMGKACSLEDFSYWSEFSIDYPDGTETLLKELYPEDNMTPQELFLAEYEELCRKHWFIINACGCCNSPWIVPLDENIKYDYFDHLKDSYPDNSKAERADG